MWPCRALPLSLFCPGPLHTTLTRLHASLGRTEPFQLRAFAHAVPSPLFLGFEWSPWLNSQGDKDTRCHHHDGEEEADREGEGAGKDADGKLPSS